MKKKSKNLLLMSCRSPYLDDERVYPPLGLLYLKSAVNKEVPEVNVDLMDDYNLEDKTLFNNYDYVGLSVMTPQREESLNVLKHIKKHSPDTKVIIGGPHAYHYLNEVKDQPYDYIVSKDGQRDLVNILKNNPEQRMHFDQMLKADWNSQPRPDRTSKEAREFLHSYHYTLQGKKAGTMLTATGCPMACTFCEDAMTATRWSPIEKLRDEMDDLKELGYEGVYLFDDLFAIAKKKVEPITEELKKRNLIYRCNGQANFFTKWGDSFAKLLGESGCKEIAFGHETGSQKILDNIRKKTLVEQNYKSIEYAKKYGIHVKSFLMLGLPGEDHETLADTERFIKEGGMDDFQLAIYYPYKGTQIRDAIDKNEADFDLHFEGEGLGAYGQKGGSTESVVSTKALSSEYLLEFRDYLVDKYTPKSHKEHWKQRFHDTHLKTEVEYEGQN